MNGLRAASRAIGLKGRRPPYRRMIRHLTSGVFLMCGCASPAKYVWVDNYPPAQGSPQGYVVGVGDELNVQVFDNDKLSARTKVRSDGSISLPLLNDVPVQGRTPAAVARDVERLLRDRNLVLNPHVNVVVENVSKIVVSVVGQVVRPGSYSLEPGAGLVEALASAGGLNDFAHKDRIYVRRLSEHVVIRFRFDAITSQTGPAASFRLQNGDAVVAD